VAIQELLAQIDAEIKRLEADLRDLNKAKASIISVMGSDSPPTDTRDLLKEKHTITAVERLQKAKERAALERDSHKP
jgi:hypothetical protein